MVPHEEPDLYAVLSLASSATFAEIRSAYRRAALVAHPDKGGRPEDFAALTGAFMTLSEEAARESYDRRRAVAPAVKMPPAAARRGNLLRLALERLRRTLQRLESSERQSAITGMRPKARAALLNFMESASKLDSAKTLARPEPEHSAETAGELDGDCSPMLASPTRSSSRLRSLKRRSGRLGIQQSHSMQRPLFRATLMFSNLKFWTRFQGDMGLALEHHILLVQIRQAALAGCGEGGPTDDRIHDACTSVLEKAGTTAQGLGLRVQVELNVGHRPHRQYVGSPVVSLEDALAWRTRLLSARRLGWPSFRTVWSELLQHPSFVRRRPLSEAEANAFVDRRYRLLESAWSCSRKHMRRAPACASPTKRPAADGGRQAQRRFELACQRVQRILDTSHVQKRKAAVAAARGRLTSGRRRLRQEQTMKGIAPGSSAPLRRRTAL